jgi:hypothetical protein
MVRVVVTRPLLPFAIVVLLAGPAAQEHEHGGMAGDTLGTVHFATSCADKAQPAFDRAVALLHSFEFAAAIEGFDAALAADPSCAMTEWGVALSRWGNPFAPGVRPAAQLREGLAAIERARAIGPKTDRERAYVAAAAQLYTDAEHVPQQRRIDALRDAMGRVAERYPDDAEAAIFYALWLSAAEDPSDKTYAGRLKAIAILEPLFARQPNHPGLAHYIIHSCDVPALASHALEAANRYAQIAPAAPHALHMPSHTFTRLGLWQQSIETNIASAAAARREHATSEELHATDYQMYAYLQTGQDAAARRLLDALPEIMSRFSPTAIGSAAPPSAGAFASAAIPARWALERGAWADAARLDLHPSGLPYADALTEFARALGAARAGDAAAARTAVAALERLRERQSQLNEPYWAEQIAIQRRSAAAWLALAEGRRADALAEMRAAADAEDRTEKAALTPGPLAPARELLGEMLLESNDARGALGEFERTLVKEPNRFRALYGAAKAATLAHDGELARRYFTELASVCERADTPGRREVQEARASAASPRATEGGRRD